MKHDPVRRRLAAALATLVAVTGLALAAPGGPALAAPGPLAAPGDSGDDGEGGSKDLVEALNSASKRFVEAKDALAKSKQRQQELTAKVADLDKELGPRQSALDDVVRQTYQTGRLGPVGALLTASESSSLLDRVDTLEKVAVKQDKAIRDLKNTRDEQAKAKAAIDAEVRNQQRQVNLMAKGKTQAENALKAHNAEVAAESSSSDSSSASSDSSSSGSSSSGSNNTSRAEPAPRNSDGSLPSESCSLNDPTTSGCISPRTLHAMQEAKKDGFTRFVACFREQSTGEHPLGKACDFAADKSGFGGVATGSSRTYGNNLADYFIANADRLGVLYVIWFKRIWLPSSGWKAYSRGNGDPSSDHTNHVHLSMR